MKKSFILAIAALLFSLLIGGCSSDAPRTDNTHSEPSAAEHSVIPESSADEKTIPSSSVVRSDTESSRAADVKESSAAISEKEIQSSVEEFSAESSQETEISTIISDDAASSEREQSVNSVPNEAIAVQAVYKGEVQDLSDEDKEQLFLRTREALAVSYSVDLSVDLNINERMGERGLCMEIRLNTPQKLTVESNVQTVSEITVLVDDTDSLLLWNGGICSFPKENREELINYIESLHSMG